MSTRAWHSVLIPAAVFQSVIVGGAYGTGREVAEFISRYGAWGGFAAIVSIACGFGIILAVSFEFARLSRTYDYRSFLRALLGRGWVLYELMFVLLLIIVLAVTGAAAGRVIADTLRVPAIVGTATMLLAVVVFTFWGRRLVELTLTIGAVLLSLALLFILVDTWRVFGPEIRETLRSASILPGWQVSAFKFVLYNSALAPVLLYAVESLQTRRAALTAGLLAGVAGTLPALFFHLAFMSHFPRILDEPIPTYWLIGQLATPGLLPAYVAVLFMTIVQTGVGVLQGVNERLDNWRRERRGASMSRQQHAALAGGAVLLSLLLAEAGLVALVAKGYGTLAWGFLCVYTLPILTIGVARILQHRKGEDS